MLELLQTPTRGVLWGLRGDGGQAVVLSATACGAHCGTSVETVYELREGRFENAAVAPHNPATMTDADGDGVPEFKVALLDIEVAGCPHASCGDTYRIG